MAYSETEVRRAAQMVAPEAVDAALAVEDFCTWWGCLDWFHAQGIRGEEALAAASTRLMKVPATTLRTLHSDATVAEGWWGSNAARVG